MVLWAGIAVLAAGVGLVIMLVIAQQPEIGEPPPLDGDVPPPTCEGSLLPVAPAQQDPVVQQQALAQIATTVPGFRASDVAGRVAEAAVAVLGGWGRGDLDSYRPLVTAALWQRHRTQWELYREQHRHNVVDDLHILSTSVVSALCDPVSAQLRIRMRIGGVDCDIGDRGSILRGTRRPRTWTQDWLAQRMMTSATAGGHCPYCAAPRNATTVGRCQFCGGDTGAAAEWVVTGFVRTADLPQPGPESRAVEAPILPPVPLLHRMEMAGTPEQRGFDDLRTSDPDLSLDALCEGARTAVLAVRSAWNAASVEGIRWIMTPEALEGIETAMTGTSARGQRRSLSEPIVGDAVVLEAGHSAASDRVVIRVPLVCSDRLVSGLDQTRDDAAPEMDRHVDVSLVRTQTSTDRCPSCGAPLRHALFGHCRFCGATVDVTGWLIGSISDFEVGRGKPLPSMNSDATPAGDHLPPDAVAAVRARWPAFEGLPFFAMVRSAFYAVEQARQHGDPERAKPYLEPTFYVEWSTRVTPAHHDAREISNLSLGKDLGSDGRVTALIVSATLAAATTDARVQRERWFLLPDPAPASSSTTWLVAGIQLD